MASLGYYIEYATLSIPILAVISMEQYKTL